MTGIACRGFKTLGIALPEFKQALAKFLNLPARQSPSAVMDRRWRAG